MTARTAFCSTRDDITARRPPGPHPNPTSLPGVDKQVCLQLHTGLLLHVTWMLPKMEVREEHSHLRSSHDLTC